MASIVAKNNSKVLSSTQGRNPNDEKCNCRNKAECPLPGKCQIKSVIYQATVKTTNTTENYIGLTANTFKERFGRHKTTFKYIERKKETTLSKHIWELKSQNTPFDLEWKILARAEAFSPVTGFCQLCTREKYLIAFKPELGSLNSRNELLNSCRHKRTSLLTKTKTKRKKRNPGG